MNSKTNHEYASNSYNGGIMGSDSPAALLDMLAEVASQTLHSEKKRNKSLVPSQCKSRTDYVKRKNHESCFTVPQLLSMPASQLVKQFSIFTSDELKRQYSYTCALVVGCGQKYTSFASEGRARMSIKAHLAEHLEYLKTNKETYKTFTAKSVSYKGYKSSPQNKKGRLQQLRKPQETLNKENKNVSPEKPTNYLRNILLNDSTFKELDKNKNVENAENAKKLHSSDQKDTDRTDFKVLGDHSYFERLKDEVPLKKEASSFSDSPENTANENIVLMVVGTDSVHMKEYPRIKKLSEKIHGNSEAIYLPEIAWSAESEDKKNVEIATTKPKGKAKFIGTSKEEREMALAFMDRIKKKGNPTGSNLECRICNPPRSFTAPTTLVSHYRSHAGIKPYECRICRAVFTRRHSLKYHMLIHQNQTRFTCADCGKKFRHPSHFREHRRRHTGEAPFGCDDCGQRFKTRNTYKRHLKTRHGKVLTTTGELLYLSEEDFEKVRTNRKKKNDTSREQHGLDEDVRAAKAIMRYENNDEGEQQEAAALTEEYIINDDTIGSDKNWESNDAIEIMKDCFEAYEVCPESHLNKTESIETEIPMETRYCTSDENSLPNEYADKVQDKSPHSPSTSYINLEAVKDGSDEIVCHGSAGQREIIYRDVNQPPSYIKVQYSSLVNGIEDGDALQLQQDHLELSEQQQIIEQTEEHYLDADCNDSNGGQPQTNSMQASSRIEANGDRRAAILAEEDAKYEEEGSDAIALHCSSFQEMKAHEICVPGELMMNLNTLREANGANGANGNIADTLTRQMEDCASQEEKAAIGNNDQTVLTNLINNRIIAPSNNYAAEQGKKWVNQADGLRICCNEPVTSIIVQNKCFNILPQVKSKILLNKSQKFTLLNKHMQAINIKQNGNQNTILLLTNDALQSSVFNKRDRKESAADDDDDEMEKQ